MNNEVNAEIVGWIGGLGAAGVPHVEAHLAPNRSYSKTWISRGLMELAHAGLLAQHRILVRRPALYVATRKGLRWRGLDGLGPCKVSDARFEHAWQIADAAVALAAGLPDWKVMSDREILWYERKRHELIASTRVGSNGKLHRPDLALLSPDGRVVAVEVELSEKEPSRLAAICNGWARARHVDVVYYLSTPAVARAVSRAARKTRSEDCVRILPLGQTQDVVRLEREATGGGDDERR